MLKSRGGREENEKLLLSVKEKWFLLPLQQAERTINWMSAYKQNYSLRYIGKQKYLTYASSFRMIISSALINSVFESECNKKRPGFLRTFFTQLISPI